MNSKSYRKVEEGRGSRHRKKTKGGITQKDDDVKSLESASATTFYKTIKLWYG